jgi:hypothetical protein
LERRESESDSIVISIQENLSIPGVFEYSISHYKASMVIEDEVSLGVVYLGEDRKLNRTFSRPSSAIYFVIYLAISRFPLQKMVVGLEAVAAPLSVRGAHVHRFEAEPRGICESTAQQ